MCVYMYVSVSVCVYMYVCAYVRMCIYVCESNVLISLGRGQAWHAMKLGTFTPARKID